MEHKISANHKVLGRLASEIALLLRGKNKANYQPQILPQVKVIVSEADKIIFSGKKLAQKKYYHYSGYPGGMRTRYLNEEFSKNPGRVLRLAVYRMLPKNRQRSRLIKNLIIK